MAENKKNQSVAELKKQLREAIANYMYSEGCGCCSGDNHEDHGDAIGKLLNFKRYKEGGGYDFYSYRTDAKKDLNKPIK